MPRWPIVLAVLGSVVVAVYFAWSFREERKRPEPAPPSPYEETKSEQELALGALWGGPEAPKQVNVRYFDLGSERPGFRCELIQWPVAHDDVEMDFLRLRAWQKSDGEWASEAAWRPPRFPPTAVHAVADWVQKRFPACRPVDDYHSVPVRECGDGKRKLAILARQGSIAKALLLRQPIPADLAGQLRAAGCAPEDAEPVPHGSASR